MEAVIPQNQIDCLQITFRNEERVLELEWRGTVLFSDLRQGYYQMLDMLKEKPTRRFIFDLRNRRPIPNHEQLWVTNTIFPKLLAQVNETVFIAALVPAKYLDAEIEGLEPESLMDNDNFIIIQNFLLPEEAKRWLAEQR